MEIAKSRPLKESNLHEWYDCLISHIPKSVKKSVSNAEEKNMKLFEIKIEKYASNNIPKDYKPKRIADAFKDTNIKYKGEGGKNQSNNILKRLRYT